MAQDIQDLFHDELNSIYQGEKKLIEAYPVFEEAAQSVELKALFHTQFGEAKEQLLNLERIFQLVGNEYKEVKSAAILGLIEEVKGAIRDYTESPLRDAALIARVQRIKHYEISVYGTLVAFADELDLDDSIDLLRKSLDEEAIADQKLTDLAAGGLFSTGINHLAHRS